VVREEIGPVREVVRARNEAAQGGSPHGFSPVVTGTTSRSRAQTRRSVVFVRVVSTTPAIRGTLTPVVRSVSWPMLCEGVAP